MTASSSPSGAASAIDQLRQAGLVGVARHHMHVQVEDLLPGDRSDEESRLIPSASSRSTSSRATASTAGPISASGRRIGQQVGDVPRGTTREWPRARADVEEGDRVSSA